MTDIRVFTAEEVAIIAEDKDRVPSSNDSWVRYEEHYTAFLDMSGPSARDALQAIANLPTGKSEDVMEGQEQAYRAVEALFSVPPVIHTKPITSDVLRPITGLESRTALEVFDIMCARIRAEPTSSPVITDAMVERAARAVEKATTQDKYGWSDELFDIWWNKDPYFVEKETGWGDAFGVGTRKNHLLWTTRIALEAALS